MTASIEDTGSAALAVTGSAAPTVQGGRFAGGDEVVVLLDGGVTGRFMVREWRVAGPGGRSARPVGQRSPPRIRTFVVVVMACWCPAAGSRYLHPTSPRRCRWSRRGVRGEVHPP